jgi:type VI secretion system secreted protein Hcp
MFLKLDGILGESVDATHKDEIDLLSFAFGESVPVILGGGGGSAGGLPSFEDFHFTARVSRASPHLFISSVTGTHIKDAVVTVRKAGAAPHEFLEWKLTTVVVSSYNQAGAGEVPLDEFSLSFGVVEMTYTPQKADGSPGTPISVGWNRTTNKKV